VSRWEEGGSFEVFGEWWGGIGVGLGERLYGDSIG
jgi:hypothetical protein